LTMQTSRFFDEPLTTFERDEYPKKAFYYSQIDPIITQVTPVNDKGKGVVWLGNWQYKEGKMPPRDSRFFHYVYGPWDLDHDISSEAWVAQEDLWIQRELYYRIKLANDYLSKFQGKPVEGFNKSSTFTNPYWEITLTLQGSEDDSKLVMKLKNLLPRRQKVQLSFKVQLHKNHPPEEIEVDHVAVDPKAETNEEEPAEAKDAKDAKGEKKKGRVDTAVIVKDLEKGVPRDGIYSVEQVLTVHTAAVKRIE